MGRIIPVFFVMFTITMKATDVILSLHKTGELQKLCRTVAPPRYSDDLIQEVLLALLEKPEAKIIEMQTAGYLKWYVVRMACNMYQSKHSGFHKLYRHFDVSDGNIETMEAIDREYDFEADSKEQQKIDGCNDAYNRLAAGSDYPYEQKLLDLHLTMKNKRAISRLTGIPYRTVCHNLDTIYKSLRDAALNY
jgi:DNA-directed RNA polymerase specialized sigma24 family protein